MSCSPRAYLLHLLPTESYFEGLTCSAGLRDRNDMQAEGGSESRLSILIRDGRHGRDEPSLGLRHSIDTTVMQVGSRGWGFGPLRQRERDQKKRRAFYFLQ